MIPLFKVHKPAFVLDKISEVLSSGYWAEGDSVRLFEKYLQEFMRNPNILTTNSCTSALHLALKIAGVKEGTYVLTTPMTCIASTVSINHLGGIPVWVDVDAYHGMLTVETIKKTWELLTPAERSKVKALLYVCWGGDLGPIEEVDQLCKELNIKLIIDAAQAFGTHYNKIILGDCIHGDMVAFSFQAIKHISTGDGGALAFRNKADYERASKLKWFGIDRDGFRTPSGEIDWNSNIPEIGYKFHMNNIAGAIGVAHMEELKATKYARLYAYIANDAFLTLGLANSATRSWHNPTSSWVATFLVDNPLRLLSYLKERGVHTSQMHVSNDIYTGFNNALTLNELKGVEYFTNHHLCFPCGSWVSQKDIDMMVGIVSSYNKDYLL